MALAYGFHSIENLLTRRIADNVAISRQLINEWSRVYQELRRDFISRSVQTVTWAKYRYEVPNSAGFQPLDEWGNAKPIQGYDEYEIGLPIRGGGLAHGVNRLSREEMTLEDLSSLLLMIEQADNDFIFRHAMAAFMTSTTYTWKDKSPKIGNLSVKPFANGDSDVYVKNTGIVATDNHYSGQADPIDNSHNPFPTLKTELSEHPSNNITASNPVVFFVATNLLSTVMALTEFMDVDNPLVIPGVSSDRVSPTVGRYLGYGSEVKGILRDTGAVVVEWNQLPDNYIHGRPANKGPFLAMREYPYPRMRGLINEFWKNDPSREMSQFLRFAGFGVTDRVGGLMHYIGNASYQNSATYTAPLPV